MKKLPACLALATSVVLVAAGCASQEADSTAVIYVGTSECCGTLDPANTYTASDWPFLQQIYPSLLNVVPGSSELVYDAAESAEYLDDKTYRVTMRDGLTFSNGNELSASDAVFSLKRIIDIASPSGPSILLANVEDVVLVDPKTFDIKLKISNDATIPRLMSSMVGLIVDEEVFPATEALSNEEVVQSASFAGPYLIQGFETSSYISLVPNPSYDGAWGKPKNSGVVVRAYQDSSNMLSDFENGKLDTVLAYRSSLTDDIFATAEKPGNVLFHGPTTESVAVYFNIENMPFGSNADQVDLAKASAVRQAISVAIDRDRLNQNTYFGVYKPLYSAVPSDFQFSISAELQKEKYSVSESRAAQAQAILSAAGIDKPVSFNLLTSSSKYGDIGIRLASDIKDQLESTGMFEVSISDIEWADHRERRKSGNFESTIFAWGQDFADADNYISPIAKSKNFLEDGYSNSEVDGLADLELSTNDPEIRAGIFAELQRILDQDLPYVPLLSGGPVTLAKENVSGAENLVLGDFKYIFPYLSK